MNFDIITRLRVKSGRQIIIKDQRGYILGLVMVFFVVFSIIGLSFIKMGSNERIHAFKDYHKEKAYYYAHSGIHKGLWRVSKISNAAGTFSDATVNVVYDSVSLTMTATGTSGNVQDSIRVTLRSTGGSGGGGGSDLLFVVPNAASLSAQDVARKTLMESWGYNITLISANDSQANFDAAVATVDVAYVSQEISSGDLGTKLKDKAIGFVNEEILLADDYGFGQTRETFDESEIKIEDNSHYVTSPFSTGLLTICTSQQDLHGSGGTLAADLVILANEPVGSLSTALVVIETGGALYGGGNAAGRRVELPWGRNAFDFNSLNDDGKTIMKRTIEWAAGASSAGATTVTIATWEEL